MLENAGGGGKMVERAVNAILISADDDVATVIAELSAGDQDGLNFQVILECLGVKW